MFVLTCWCRDAQPPAEPAAGGGKPGWCNTQSAGEKTASPGQRPLYTLSGKEGATTPAERSLNPKSGRKKNEVGGKKMQIVPRDQCKVQVSKLHSSWRNLEESLEKSETKWINQLCFLHITIKSQCSSIPWLERKGKKKLLTHLQQEKCPFFNWSQFLRSTLIKVVHYKISQWKRP